jgi:hypothetical protein
MNTKAIVYDQMMQEISAIPKEKILSPSMPMDIYIQEAIDLYHWAQSDKTQLIEAGLPEELLEDLPFRADAASEAHSIWHNFLFGQSAALQKWHAESPEAWDIRQELIHSMRYAYRHDVKIRNRVAFIESSETETDIITDLRTLSVIGRENPAPLRNIGFDLALLEKAHLLSQGMEELKASSSEESTHNMIRRLRDQAYTHLKEAVDAIRECGQYVFWKDTAHRVGYEGINLQRTRRQTGDAFPAPHAEPPPKTASGE